MNRKQKHREHLNPNMSTKPSIIRLELGSIKLSSLKWGSWSACSNYSLIFQVELQIPLYIYNPKNGGPLGLSSGRKNCPTRNHAQLSRLAHVLSNWAPNELLSSRISNSSINVQLHPYSSIINYEVKNNQPKDIFWITPVVQNCLPFAQSGSLSTARI